MGQLIGLLAVFSIFFVPITGLMFILTTRFAFKPLAEALAKALRESGYSRSPQQLSLDQDLAEQIELLRDEVRQLRDAQEFDNQLLGSPSSRDTAPPSEKDSMDRDRESPKTPCVANTARALVQAAEGR